MVQTKERMELPVDVDDRKTWPPQVDDIVDKWAKQCKGTTEYTNDLALALEDEKEFRELLSGCFLRAYHCTRLLPHEIPMVVEIGLRPLSADLLYDRINSAEEAGAIGPEDAENLRAAHVFATGNHRYRENQVCLILSKSMFIHSLHGCKPLLENWGGEGIYRSPKVLPILDRLKGLSKPTVVIALLDLSGRNSPHNVYPALHKVFVGAALRFSDVGADVSYKAPVPAEHVERLLQPGELDYELLGDLP